MAGQAVLRLACFIQDHNEMLLPLDCRPGSLCYNGHTRLCPFKQPRCSDLPIILAMGRQHTDIHAGLIPLNSCPSALMHSSKALPDMALCITCWSQL